MSLSEILQTNLNFYEILHKEWMLFFRFTFFKKFFSKLCDKFPQGRTNANKIPSETIKESKENLKLTNQVHLNMFMKINPFVILF